jgi:hypothetical protein
MTDQPADETLTPPKAFRHRRAAAIGMSVLASGFALAGGSALLGGAASASAPAPTLSPSVAAQVAQAAAAPVAAAVSAPISSVPAPVVSAPTPQSTQSADDAAIDAFFAAGYTYDDAVTLAKAWGSTDPFETKVAAGRKLEAGEKLPIAPGPVDPATAADAAEGAAVDTFFSAGYTYDDAVQLAKIWGGDSYHAKVVGGQKLLAGETLPVKP